VVVIAMMNLLFISLTGLLFSEYEPQGVSAHSAYPTLVAGYLFNKGSDFTQHV